MEGNNNKANIYVFKFNFAGSGDLLWRKCIDGKIRTHGDQKKLFDEAKSNNLFKIENNNNEYLFAGNDLKNCYGDPISKTNFSLGQDIEIEKLDSQKMEVKYGEKHPYAFIWRKIKNKKKNDGIYHIITYSIPGVSAGDILPAVRDKGTFSIKNNSERVFKMLKYDVENYSKILNKNNGDRIYIKIKGHSRGGVAANFLLKKIKSDPDITKFEKSGVLDIVAVSFDPVPGDKLWREDSNNNEEYNEILFENEINGAIIYSISPKTENSFKPQKIYNYKVVIISELDHTVGLATVDEDKKHKHYYELDGKKYSPGNLWKLEKGLYFADKNFKLKKLNYGNMDDILDKIRGKIFVNQRFEFLSSLVYNKLISTNIIDAEFERAKSFEHLLKRFIKIFERDKKTFDELQKLEKGKSPIYWAADDNLKKFEKNFSLKEKDIRVYSLRKLKEYIKEKPEQNNKLFEDED